MRLVMIILLFFSVSCFSQVFKPGIGFGLKPWDFIGCDSGHYNQSIRKRNLDSAMIYSKSMVSAILFDKFLFSMKDAVMFYPVGSDSLTRYFQTTFLSSPYYNKQLDSVVVYWLTNFSQ